MTRRMPIMRFAVLLAVGLAATAAIASAAMRSTKVGPALCETTGGGKFVDIPGFDGEKIDRRLLADVRMLERRYKIFVTDGYSTSDVHAANGEHPIGLALDIVPEQGGRRDLEPDRQPRPLGRAAPEQAAQPVPLGRLRRRRQPRSRPPSAPLLESLGGQAGPPARTVYTVRCPAPGAGGPAPTPQPEPQPPPGGGTIPGGGGLSDPDDSVTAPPTGSGGIGSKPRLAAPVVESDGVDG